MRSLLAVFRVVRFNPAAQMKNPLSMSWISIASSRHISYSSKESKLKVPGAEKDRPFVDRIRILAKGGDGGSGCTSFRKSRSSRHGFADGGNGGKGGDVILVASPDVRHLAGIQPSINASKGGSGSSKGKHGTRGANQIVHVPVGTVVWFLDGHIPNNDATNETNCDSTTEITEKVVESITTNSFIGGTGSPDDSEDSEQQEDGEELQIDNFIPNQRSQLLQVADLDRPELEVTLALGGEGGKGNAMVTKSKVGDLLLPSLLHAKGTKGTLGTFLLEIKSIADVGLVGAPNAGKSTLLRALSGARPRVGSYAFTTLKPQLGTLELPNYSRMTIADIPGLIEGAHKNRGLGHGFLRHIERTRVLAFVLDMDPPERNLLPWEQFERLTFELGKYLPGLCEKPFLIVANKMDEPSARLNLLAFSEKFPKVEIYPTCAVLEEGIDDLKKGLEKMYFKYCI